MGKAIDRLLWLPGLLARGYAAQGELRKRCAVCGFRMRGPDHNKGKHHAIKHPRLR